MNNGLSINLYQNDILSGIELYKDSKYTLQDFSPSSVRAAVVAAAAAVDGAPPAAAAAASVAPAASAPPALSSSALPAVALPMQLLQLLPPLLASSLPHAASELPVLPVSAAPLLAGTKIMNKRINNSTKPHQMSSQLILPN